MKPSLPDTLQPSPGFPWIFGLILTAIACFLMALCNSCTSVYNKRSGYVGAVGGKGKYTDEKEGVTVEWDNIESYKDTVGLGRSWIRWNNAPSVINSAGKALNTGIGTITDGVVTGKEIDAVVPPVAEVPLPP